VCFLIKTEQDVSAIRPTAPAERDMRKTPGWLDRATRDRDFQNLSNSSGNFGILTAILLASSRVK